MRKGASAFSALELCLLDAGLRIAAPLRIDAVDSEAVTERFLVVVLPILGDNDLVSDFHIALQNLADSGTFTNCAVIVVLSGDRHVRDEILSKESPIIVKLNQIFEHHGVFFIDRRKLDSYTAPKIAEWIAEVFSAIRLSDITTLDELTQILGSRPKWSPIDRELDLYSLQTGFSLLYKRHTDIIRYSASLILELAPNALQLSGSGICDKLLYFIAPTLDVPYLNLANNSLTFTETSRHLSKCRWLSLGANGISNADLSTLPRSIETIYLYKNLLKDICLYGCHANQFKTISLYRNRLSRLEWPVDQLAVVRLNLGANPLRHLPDTLSMATNLESLNIARTQITRLPDWIFYLPRLRELDVSFIEEALPKAQLTELRQMGVVLVTRPEYKETLDDQV